MVDARHGRATVAAMADHAVLDLVYCGWVLLDLLAFPEPYGA